MFLSFLLTLIAGEHIKDILHIHTDQNYRISLSSVLTLSLIYLSGLTTSSPPLPLNFLFHLYAHRAFVFSLYNFTILLNDLA